MQQIKMVLGITVELLCVVAALGPLTWALNFHRPGESRIRDRRALPTCAPGFTYVEEGDRCYWLNKEPQTYEDADITCRQAGYDARLADLTDVHVQWGILNFLYYLNEDDYENCICDAETKELCFLTGMTAPNGCSKTTTTTTSLPLRAAIFRGFTKQPVDTKATTQVLPCQCLNGTCWLSDGRNVTSCPYQDSTDAGGLSTSEEITTNPGPYQDSTDAGGISRSEEISTNPIPPITAEYLARQGPLVAEEECDASVPYCTSVLKCDRIKTTTHSCQIRRCAICQVKPHSNVVDVVWSYGHKAKETIKDWFKSIWG